MLQYSQMPGKLMLETSALSSWERIILVVIIPRIVLGIICIPLKFTLKKGLSLFGEDM